MEFQPGRLLYQVIVAAFRVHGSTFTEWCKANDVSHSSARATCYGQMSSPAGRRWLSKIVEAAGRQTVEHLYVVRVREGVRRVEKAVAGERS